nr:unnamed protein product [Spirometra erinaceieuropaei]
MSKNFDNSSAYGRAEKILGFTQRRRSDCVNGSTLQFSVQTTRVRSHNDGFFRQLREELTAKCARNDRKKYWTETSASMKQVSHVGHGRKLYQIVGQVNGMSSVISTLVRDVNDGFSADNSAKVGRWCDHLEHLLNSGEELIKLSFSSAAEFYSDPTYAVACNPPFGREIADAIQRLHKKAPEVDRIPPEI